MAEEMAVSALGNSSSRAIRLRKSLTLLCCLVQQRGSRKRGVLVAPRTPKTSSNHPLLQQVGMEPATGMAPPTKGRGVRWGRLTSLYLPNYGSHASRSDASETLEADSGWLEQAARP